VEVNEKVRKNEASFRIQQLDETLDFAGIIERFKIANGKRELLSEKPLTYLKKTGSTTSLEVLVILFTDMMLILRWKKDELVLFKPPIPFEAAVFLDKPDAGVIYEFLIKLISIILNLICFLIIFFFLSFSPFPPFSHFFIIRNL